jgi:hypothetical protein
VHRVASLPPGVEEAGSLLDKPCVVTGWFEDLALDGAQALATLDDGRPLVALNHRACYVAAGLDAAGWLRLLEHRALAAGLTTHLLPPDLRVSHIGNCCIAQNFSADPIEWRPADASADLLLGHASVSAHGVSIWRVAHTPNLFPPLSSSSTKGDFS